MSHVFSRTPLRPSRARRAAFVLAAVVALGACSQNRSVPDSYGDTTRKNFTESCEQGLTSDEGEGEALSEDDAKSVCECSYESISDPDGGIPFERFKEINDAQESNPTALPDELSSRILACSDEAGPS